MKCFYDIKVRYLLYSKLKEKNTHTLLDELWEWISLDEINIRYVNTKESIDWDKAVSKLERKLELQFIEESYMGA